MTRNITSIKIEDCVNNSDVISGYASGIISQIDDGPEVEIKNCINNGNINCNTDYGYAAGIIAYTRKFFTKIYNYNG